MSRIFWLSRSRSLSLVVSSFLALSCGGVEGPEGPAGPQGPAGATGEQGAPGAPGEGAAISEFQLVGARFFPEGIAAASDGRLFVGSMTSGEIVVQRGNEVKPQTFVGAEVNGGRGVTGLEVDEVNKRLLACIIDVTFATPNGFREFALDTGKLLRSVDLAPGQLCNDLTFDGSGNVYATDSFGFQILRLRAGASAFEVWSKDEAFAGPPMGFTVNGIAQRGDALYVVRTDAPNLYRVEIGANGAAGAVTQIVVDQPLQGADGILFLSDTELLAVEDVGRLSALRLDGNTAKKTVLSSRLTLPTTVAVRGDSAWVVEGQVAKLFANEAPEVPFLVKRVYLPQAPL